MKKKRQLFYSQLHLLTGANLKQHQLAAAHPICQPALYQIDDSTTIQHEFLDFSDFIHTIPIGYGFFSSI